MIIKYGTPEQAKIVDEKNIPTWMNKKTSEKEKEVNNREFDKPQSEKITKEENDDH